MLSDDLDLHELQLIMQAASAMKTLHFRRLLESKNSTRFASIGYRSIVQIKMQFALNVVNSTQWRFGGDGMNQMYSVLSARCDGMTQKCDRVLAQYGRRIDVADKTFRTGNSETQAASALASLAQDLYHNGVIESLKARQMARACDLNPVDARLLSAFTECVLALEALTLESGASPVDDVLARFGNDDFLCQGDPAGLLAHDRMTISKEIPSAWVLPDRRRCLTLMAPSDQPAVAAAMNSLAQSSALAFDLMPFWDVQLATTNGNARVALSTTPP